MKKNKNENLRMGCRTETRTTEEVAEFMNLFDQDWEVFVIKKDQSTGEFIWKTACCAFAKV